MQTNPAVKQNKKYIIYSECLLFDIGYVRISDISDDKRTAYSLTWYISKISAVSASSQRAGVTS